MFKLTVLHSLNLITCACINLITSTFSHISEINLLLKPAFVFHKTCNFVHVSTLNFLTGCPDQCSYFKEDLNSCSCFIDFIKRVGEKR